MFSLDLPGGAQYHQQSEGLISALTGAEGEGKPKDWHGQTRHEGCLRRGLKSPLSWTARSSLWHKLLLVIGLVEENTRASRSASGQSLVNWAQSPTPSSLISLNRSQTSHLNHTYVLPPALLARWLATSGERHYLQPPKLFLFSLSGHSLLSLAMPSAISPQLQWFGKKEKLMQAQSQNKQDIFESFSPPDSPSKWDHQPLKHIFQLLRRVLTWFTYKAS